MSDRVMLDNNGRHETLWMYQQSGSNTAMPAPDMTATPPALPALPSLPGFTSVLKAIGGPVSAAMASTLGSVASVSVQQDGGFRIRAKDNGRLFRQLGLRNDDVVTAINDVPVQDTDNALAMYRSLAGASRVKLAIVRDGKPLSVLVDLAILNK
jgi:type II secretion system protein C